MKRGDDVFLFTLIDFLIQILFFGLAFYTIITLINAKPEALAETDKIDHNKVMQITTWTGFRSLPALADFLKPIRRPKDFEKWVYFMSSHDLKDVELKVNFIDEHGGLAKVGQDIRALGLPSCLAQDKERNGATAIARLKLNDESIEFISETPMFSAVMAELDLRAPVIMKLDLAQFRQLFAPLRTRHPDCRYFVNISEETKLHAPRDAVASAFRIGSR